MAMFMGPPVVLESEATAVNHDTNRPAKVLHVAGYDKVVLAVTGTAGTMKLEAQVSLDGTNWIAVGAVQLGDGVNKTAATGIVAVGAYEVPVAGFTMFRAFLSAVSGTTLTVKATAYPR
jgi:hypothetical protein